MVDIYDDPDRCSSCGELISDCQCYNEIDNTEFDEEDDDVMDPEDFDERDYTV
jgi:hypothetical protein